MKQKSSIVKSSVKQLLFFGWAIVFSLTSIQVNAQNDSTNVTNQVALNEMIASVHADNRESFSRIAYSLYREREQSINQLLNIFNDKKSANLQRCAASFYLGELRAAEAVNILAANITLDEKDFSEDEMQLFNLSATAALIKIGNPSIPAVIRNLAESDDAQVRDLSLKVLCQIEGDKDIVQLRLQKALAAEKDSQRQARLQAAIKALGGTSVEK